MTLEKKNNYKLISDYLLDLQKVDSLEKMDNFVGLLTEAVNEVYPCISCKTGCYTCCTGASMPSVYAKEWQRIREYIKTMPEDLVEQIKTNVENLVSEKSETLNFIHALLHSKVTTDEMADVAAKLSEDMSGQKCPLHIDGKCSVYSVRPTKCRVFGYFSFVFNNEVQFLSCVSDNIKMREYLSENKTKQLSVPYWNYIERKLVSFVTDQNEPFNMSVIPLWLKNDIDSGNL
jgi:Fe-S-cluster containining protein